LVDAYGLRRTAIALAQWLAFQLSIWHEIRHGLWVCVDRSVPRIRLHEPAKGEIWYGSENFTAAEP
jgi:hypothetical protein